MKKLTLYLFTLLSLFLFSGCMGTLSVAATTVSVVSTTQEIEEDYDGDVIEYVEDKLSSTYEYLEEKIAD